MASRSIFGAVAACVLAAATMLSAQTARAAYEAELSVPFGTVKGKLLLLGEHLVFVDDLQLPDSFVIPRELINTVVGGSQMATVETKQPVRDRSGERVRFSFKLEQADPAMVTRWFQARGGTGAGALPAAPALAAVPGAADPMSASQRTYNAQHDHRLGSCQGRLILWPDRVVYEAINNIEHSRNWLLKDIRELKLDNPYTLVVEPFDGGKYTLKFQGQGLEPEVYRALVDRVTSDRGVRP